MIEISKAIQTKAPPARVLGWFGNLGGHYVEMWPEAHQEYEMLSEGAPQVGANFRTVQTIKGRKMSTRGVITQMEPGRFAWKMIPLPLMGGSYRYRPLPDGSTEITQTLQYGPAWPIVGPAMLFLMERVAVSRADLGKHLAEEMARLQQALEAAQ
jgi:hypothetical protein